MYLKKTARVLKSFEHGKEQISPTRNTITYQYNVLLSNFERETSITFVVQLDSTKRAFAGLRSFADGAIVAEATSTQVFVLGQIIEQEIKDQNFGIESEEIFLTEFLLPMKRRWSDEILYVHYAGKNKDFKCGVDFIVGFKPAGLDNVFEVKFNLKSSERYIEKHKARYPGISTFVFKRRYLEDWKRLRCTFFIFLKRAVQEKVVHCWHCRP